MKPITLNEFADKLNEIMPVMIKEFARRQVNELYRGKITLPQFLILEFLKTQGECKMKVLALGLGVTTPAMTGIVDRLVRYGYVQRVFEPGDRRIIKIRLTNRGTDLVKKINQQRRQMILKVFGKISQAEREDYLRILLRIREIIT
jgi:DNA-binding MarR family transcriptional regulator